MRLKYLTIGPTIDTGQNLTNDKFVAKFKDAFFDMKFIDFQDEELSQEYLCNLVSNYKKTTRGLRKNNKATYYEFIL